MKKSLVLFLTMLIGCVMVSCSDSESGVKHNYTFNKVQLKKGSIVGANTLAVASKQSKKTRAAGDAEMVDALYKVSDDGTFIQVTYTFDLEVALDNEDESDSDEQKEIQTVIQRVNANLCITPNFIYNVGEDYLWLANCFYYVPGYESMPEDGVKKALTQIVGDFNDSHRAAHGGHYLIRKSTGDMFEWTPENAAPYAMNDGYNPPSMLGRWFHAIGKSMYVRDNFFHPLPYYGNPFCTGRVVRINDNGSSLSYTEIIPASQNVTTILPAGQNLGVICTDQKHYPIPYIYFTGTNKLVPLQTPTETREGESHWSLLSVGGELYAMNSYHRGDANEGGNILSFHKINYGNNTAEVGDEIAQSETSVGWDDDKFFGTGACTTSNTFTYFSQDYRNNWKTTINTFDPKATDASQRIRTRYLPDHYNDNSGFYVEGIACNEVTDQGFYVCDLSKDEAEYVSLDWSTAAEWQSKVKSMEYVHFEAAFMAVKYDVKTTDGQNITAWVPITGEDRGKVAIMTDENGDPNYIINVLLAL